MIIAIDFDGTIVEHKYPDIGNPVPYAIETMKCLQEDGHKLILLTMRSGRELDEAVDYCKSKGVEFWAVNDNPEQAEWTQSRKVYANLYIDDAAYGVPKRKSVEVGLRDCVDWEDLNKCFNPE